MKYKLTIFYMSLFPFIIQDSDMSYDFIGDLLLPNLPYIAIVLLGFAIILLYQKKQFYKRKYKHYKGEFKKYENRNSNQHLNVSLKRETIGRNKDSVKSNEKTSTQTVEIKEIIKETPNEPIVLDPNLALKQVKDSTEIHISKEEVFYLPFPDKENAFYAPEASIQYNEDTFYEIKNDKLELSNKISNELMKTALNFPENHLKRVCTIINARDSGHSSVVMVEPGKVIKEEDDFVVTKKMKIEYV